MAWIRLDDQIAHHPKLTRAGLSSWLWVCCIAFSQKYLTDGFVPHDSVTALAGGIADAQQHIDALVRCGLLEHVADGYQVHDYLDFNDSATTVKAKREADRVRKESAKNPRGIQTESERNPRGVLARAPASHPIPSDPVSKSKNKLTPETETHTTSGNGNGKIPSLSPAAPAFGNPKTDPFTNPDVTERAGRFIERYQVLYPKHRNGARYAVKPVRDYAAAVTLCQTWPSDDYLDDLAAVFLTTDNKFAEEGSRTIPQFLAIASWCDSRLCEVRALKAK